MYNYLQAVLGGLDKCRDVAHAMNLYIGVPDEQGLTCVEDDTVRVLNILSLICARNLGGIRSYCLHHFVWTVKFWTRRNQPLVNCKHGIGLHADTCALLLLFLTTLLII